ncbi:putative lipid II flippase FtsW [Bdellovibrio sp. qaytius]|nr:putative lipid II flippase FtsW [Bdellovibrio sp. qaytius]
MKLQTKFLSSSLFLSIFALLGVGLVQVYSSSYIFAIESYGDGLYFFKRQAIFTVLGIIAIFSAVQIPFEKVRKYGWMAWIVAAILLVATFIPGVGVRVGGAIRWINLPMGFRFEPSELLKISFSFLVASIVCKHQNALRNLKPGWIALMVLVPILVLLKQPDFGSFAIIFAVGIALLFTFGLSLKYLMAGGIAAVPMFYLLVWNVAYRKARVQAFLDPWSDPGKKGFQVIQSMLSVHSGGLTGQGLGQSQGKLFFLPEAHTDFTMAILGEEMGFIGICAVLLLLGFVVFRGFRIAIKTEDLFKKTLALGLTITFALSVFINMGVVMGLLPTKGLTMPFLSYGGSSLVIICFMFGILLNIEASENYR